VGCGVWGKKTRYQLNERSVLHPNAFSLEDKGVEGAKDIIHSSLQE